MRRLEKQFESQSVKKGNCLERTRLNRFFQFTFTAKSEGTVLECRSRKHTRSLTLAGESRQGVHNFSHRIRGLFSVLVSSVYPVHLKKLLKLWENEVRVSDLNSPPSCLRVLTTKCVSILLSSVSGISCQ